MDVSFNYHDLVKKITRAAVLEELKNNEIISRSEISKRLNISKSTISSIIEELLDKKLVIEAGQSNSAREGGRPAKLLKFNTESGYVVGVDIGGTKILIMITDLGGKVKFKKKVPTTNNLEEIINIINQNIIESKIDSTKILGMGIGVPGTVDVNEGFVIKASALNWTNLKLYELFAGEFNFPIFVNNDVNCAALGERWKGAGDEADDLIFIAIGTGIGSAIICNGKLVYGYQYKAGEIGYYTDRLDVQQGRYNIAGQRLLFEEKVSGTSLGTHGYLPEEIFTKFSQGNEKLLIPINDFISNLSIGIANIVSLLNPEKVIIGGGVSESMDIVIEKIREQVNQLTPTKCDIQLATLGGEAGAIGAIAYAFQNIEDK